ncbi:AAA family ATPase [Rhizobium bangladeshense]|uniref:AAA family ATPase n=1 Tax=Rhizobium bangladeshense TaxID=1138189 RepID=UPI001C82E8D9|nr:AAA family ATPase [Rhizobium bangladeshense]MBX4899123.1 AAA family ATPase [Rhizobium bangladeshense]MBX4902441.1 AAA family ATPase [Rhizobium bangladeshense]MBY3617035.1 AAA family ATPase [Rhizobium bangladeshense]
MLHEHVRTSRKDLVETSFAGQTIGEVRLAANYLPPCQRDANAFGQGQFFIRHDDPLEARALPSVEEELPPYSCCPTPYRWMLEGNFREICEGENLQIPGRTNQDSSSTWVMEDSRQRALLNHFWGKLRKGKSLIFYYCNRGNAVDDNVSRLIVGVSRIIEIGDQIYFGRRGDRPGNFPVWSRRITSAMPKEGVRIPYQEYIALGKDPEPILCRPPNGMSLPFSYVGEHVSDGQAVSAILAILKSVERVRKDGFVEGAWEDTVDWCNGVLDEVWAGRGAFPGIGSVLRYLGCKQGHAFHATVLRELERKHQNPWDYVLGILQGRIDPTEPYRDGLLAAAKQWRSMPTRQRLIDTLVRFELTEDQVSGIANEDQRAARGIAARADKIIENPYVLFEQDRGDDVSEPVGLETIDQGMWPEGDAALFRDGEAIAHNDQRRVRAAAVAVLRDAAEAGDTLLPYETFMRRLHERFPDKRRCLADREAFWYGDEREFHDAILWLKVEPYPEKWRVEQADASGAEPVDDEFAEDLGADDNETVVPTIKLVALKSVRRQEAEIAKVLAEARALDDLASSPPNWRTMLTRPVSKGGFGEPRTPREGEAIDEKVSALETLYGQRISFLTGGAGTGKTSVLRVFLEQLRATEGPTATLLAAPTGKARVRLQVATQRSANTIHQILNDVGMLGPNYRILDKPGKGQLVYTNIVIDESSMPSVELLAALFRAIKTSAFRRLIFVGDPYQLPPIGPGRPFVDALRWMRENHPDCIAELRTCMRVTEDNDGSTSFSKGLELAAGYRDDAGPGDETVLSELVQKGETADVQIAFWKDHTELLAQLDRVLESNFGIHGSDRRAFDRSLGIADQKWKDSENWQILSPTRIQPFGTDELNRIIQGRFRELELAQARDPRSRWPGPMGDQEIVFHDKVMQRVNQQKWLPKDADGLRFVANGEIGVVAAAWKGKDDKPDNLRVVFSTQPNAEYGYRKSDVKEALELAYALTVHKAQGSDFETVILIVPRKAQTLSRELLYTGLTRFKDKLVLLVEKDSQPLLDLRRPEASDTMRRTTWLFSLLIGENAGDVGVTGSYRPEGLIHRTSDGTLVRSKSEVIVYDVLTALGLSVQYELPLLNKDGNPKDFRLPDFTIHYQGRVWYWEHLGMLDKATYRADWEQKKQWYGTNGYLDRVLTSEDHPGGLSGVVYADEIRRSAERDILRRI